VDGARAPGSETLLLDNRQFIFLVPRFRWPENDVDGTRWKTVDLLNVPSFGDECLNVENAHEDLVFISGDPENVRQTFTLDTEKIVENYSDNVYSCVIRFRYSSHMPRNECTFFSAFVYTISVRMKEVHHKVKYIEMDSIW
jgi:hypothetical protein